MKIQDPIVGDGIFLRSLGPGDVGPHYVAWLADPQVNQFLETRHSPQGLEQISKFVADMNDSVDQLLLGIFTSKGKHVGNIKLGPIHPIHRHADMSLFIGEKNVWGQGIGRKAVHALCQFAFTRLDVYKVCAGLYEQNQASLKLFTSLGFQQEGFFLNHCYFGPSRRASLIRLGLCRDDMNSTQV